MRYHSRTPAQIRLRISRLETLITKLSRICNAPQQIPGPFATGRSGYTMGKALDRENDRRASAFSRQQKAESDLKFYAARLAVIEAGEVHNNGQPRADAPSRLKAQSYEDQLGEFYRSVVKPGDLMALSDMPGSNTVRVKSINRKSITAESGSKWGFCELTLCDQATGQPIQAAERGAMFKAWEAAQTAPATEEGSL